MIFSASFRHSENGRKLMMMIADMDPRQTMKIADICNHLRMNLVREIVEAVGRRTVTDAKRKEAETVHHLVVIFRQVL